MFAFILIRDSSGQIWKDPAWFLLRSDQNRYQANFLFSFSGYGVFAEKAFLKGEFLFAYPGLLKESEDVETENQTYIFHFKENGKNLW